MARLTKLAVERADLPTRKQDEDEHVYRKRWRWLPDAEVPGFGVKIYGSGRKVFAVRYRTKAGRQRMTKLGVFGELTVQQARERAAQERVAVINGEDPQATRQRDAILIPTVGDLLTKWIEEYAKAHRKRWTEDENRIDRHVRPKLGRVRLEELTRDVLASWHRQLGKDAPVEANRCLETIRAAWRWAEGEGRLPDGLTDPTKSVKRFREEGRDRWLRKDEVKRLMKAVRAYGDPYIQVAIPLFLLTGLRKRELLTAKWEDIDLERGEIRLPETKAGRAQVRLLPRPAQDLLRQVPRMHESPYVFPRPATPSKPRDDIKKPWAKIRKDAQLEDVTLHDLRRTAGSYMAQAGVPLQVIGEVLGHSHPGVTKLYARLASENERAALDTLSTALAGVLGEQTLEPDPDGAELPSRVQALLDAHGDDPEALAAALDRLSPGRTIKA